MSVSLHPPSGNSPGAQASVPLSSALGDNRPFKVLFIGAGSVLFGSTEGGWNHSLRLEQRLGPSRLQVVGIVDIAEERVQAILAQKQASFVAPAYASTLHFRSVQEAAAQLTGGREPDLIFNGTPPALRGQTTPGADLDLQTLTCFPHSVHFVEKPVSTGTAKEATLVGQHFSKSNAPSGVGYFLRYSKAVQMMKKILEESNSKVMLIMARYIMAYEFSRKQAWWDKAKDCGPIVEQAHFCDLARYFGGEVDLATVSAHAVEAHEGLGKLSLIHESVREYEIPMDQRIPRVTSATWKFKNGAVGSLTHGVILHGNQFSTELIVYADGVELRLNDPYRHPTLHVRRPGSDTEEVHTFEDDAFLGEISAFCDATEAYRRGEEAPSGLGILSSYEDAVRTYELTWAIREASERSQEPKV